MRVLVVEDERDLNNVIVKKLTLSGYSVDSCFNGQDALDHIKMCEYDAIILDIMLPELDGIEVLERLRAENNMTPVLFLTAKDSVEDRVRGLDSGADDYLIKPFAFAELLARIRVLTRKKAGNATNVFSVADLTVNCSDRTVTRRGENISLTSKEFSILEYMIRNKGIVLQRERIEQHIWNFDYEGGSNIVDVYIRYLRRKIDDGFDNKLIHTIRGAGYVLREDK